MINVTLSIPHPDQIISDLLAAPFRKLEDRLASFAPLSLFVLKALAFGFTTRVNTSLSRLESSTNQPFAFPYSSLDQVLILMLII